MMEGYMTFRSEAIENEFYTRILPFLQNGRLRSEKITLLFMHHQTCKEEEIEEIEDDEIVVIHTRHNAPANVTESEFFDDSVFFHRLCTEQLGSVLLFLKHVTSTQDVAHLLFSFIPHELVVVAERQQSGRGRGGTTWESPLGCGLFTFNVEYGDNSVLGRNPALLGYITSCSLVNAMQQLTKGVINLRLKWPNDIYGGARYDKKIGGTLHDLIPGGIVIGVGVNVSNERPTISLNSLIMEHNKNINNNNSSNVIPPLNIDDVIATFLSNFEQLFQEIQNGRQGKLIEQFTQSWIHSNVTYSNQIDFPARPPYDVIFKGLDEKGFLLLENVGDQSEESISPRGMSVDVVNHILHRKPVL